ncbi:hypothetical protein VIOR3934_02742 [Vibrio orientalis CIP 102891 = ATCC 33934]|uniref:Uncharacterized protein n=1 Tax=Vibrio orientalis CIP 102891 = ATCC 33934 TaxID=675816 RepID=F9SX27_VIBOR|nr:hypothetical protein [Vibrio orientalis]EGU47251.1 hypothetical protein VIOR3934_02742 [Vibrio orientalis CIP 102891 = ATCC 33934]
MANSENYQETLKQYRRFGLMAILCMLASIVLPKGIENFSEVVVLGLRACAIVFLFLAHRKSMCPECRSIGAKVISKESCKKCGCKFV